MGVSEKFAMARTIVRLGNDVKPFLPVDKLFLRQTVCLPQRLTAHRQRCGRECASRKTSAKNCGEKRNGTSGIRKTSPQNER
jgi:hypothetical protein